jgi:hypothetical protein
MERETFLERLKALKIENFRLQCANSDSVSQHNSLCALFHSPATRTGKKQKARKRKQGSNPFSFSFQILYISFSPTIYVNCEPTDQPDCGA